MSATIEVKYFNSFWVKKQNSQLISAALPSSTPGTGDIGGNEINDPGVPNYAALPFKTFNTTAVSGAYPNLWPYYVNANNYTGTAVGAGNANSGFVATIGVKPEVNYLVQDQGWLILSYTLGYLTLMLMLMKLTCFLKLLILLLLLHRSMEVYKNYIHLILNYIFFNKTK